MQVRKQHTSERRTIAAFPSCGAARNIGLYYHMFIEDISGSIVPYPRRRDDRRVELEVEESGRNALEAVCTSISEHPHYEMDDLILGALEAIATRLAWFGEAVYEFCGSGETCELASITPYRLFRIPGAYIQIVPRVDRHFFNEQRFTIISSSKVWRIGLPTELGSARAHRRLLQNLLQVSQPAPEFWTHELEAGQLTTEFSIADYNRARDVYIAGVTRRWGWNRRDTSSKYDTEFFYFFRSLQFQRAIAILRDHVIHQLNLLFPILRIGAHIRLQGFPSPNLFQISLRRRRLEKSTTQRLWS